MRWEWVGILVLAALGVGVLVYRTPEPELVPARTGDPSKVTLIPIDLDGLEKEVRAHKGKVVLVDFWATWCGPCRAEFPKFVAIHEKYADRGLVCITVSLEKEPELHRESALSFLKNQHATTTNFLWMERSERGARGLEQNFGYPGSIPASALFNRAGQRIPPDDGKFFTTLELVSRIEGELAAQP